MSTTTLARVFDKITFSSFLDFGVIVLDANVLSAKLRTAKQNDPGNMLSEVVLR